jgi:run domain Beclin-1 interacting cysteine-rich containing protein
VEQEEEDIDSVVRARTPAVAVSRSSRRRRAQFVRPIVEIAPPRTLREQLARQRGRCFSCGAELAEGGAAAGFCEYTCKLHCERCLTPGDLAHVPARVLHKCDIERYPVCRRAREYLEERFAVPNLAVSVINPRLYTQSRELRQCKQLRQQLRHLRAFIETCRQRARLLEVLGDLDYMLEFDDLFSLRDLVRCLEAKLAPKLVKIVETLAHHVIDGGCALCASKGSICEYCNAPQPVFPFQLLVVALCPDCQGVFHKSCFRLGTCPRCARVARRHQREAEHAAAAAAMAAEAAAALASEAARPSAPAPAPAPPPAPSPAPPPPAPAAPAGPKRRNGAESALRAGSGFIR